MKCSAWILGVTLSLANLACSAAHSSLLNEACYFSEREDIYIDGGVEDFLKAEGLFKRAGIGFDAEFVAKYPFGIEPIMILSAIIEKGLMDKFLNDFMKAQNAGAFVAAHNNIIESVVREHRNLFHYCLVHLCYLYRVKILLRDLVEIDDIVEQNLRASIHIGKRTPEELERTLKIKMAALGFRDVL